MEAGKADIISRLQKEIQALQGLKPVQQQQPVAGLEALNEAFPDHCFPTGTIHEFLAQGIEAAAASVGFMAGLLSSIVPSRGAVVWISTKRTIFPPALQQFGIAPENVIFIELPKSKELLWAVEETLKCSALSAVIAEVSEISFTESRRLQLAVEKTAVTCFLLRKDVQRLQTTACTAQWKITSIPGVETAGLPGVGFPAWHIQLLKIKNGKPGSWQYQWQQDTFKLIPKWNVVAVPLRQIAG